MKVKTVDLISKSWIQKTYNNRYTSARLILNYGMKTEKIIKIPIKKGSHEDMECKAGEILHEMNVIPFSFIYRSYNEMMPRKVVRKWGE